MILDNTMGLKDFLSTIARYQEDYWFLDDSLNGVNRNKEISAREVETIYQLQRYIAEEVARFILNRNTRVNIYNLLELPEK